VNWLAMRILVLFVAWTFDFRRILLEPNIAVHLLLFDRVHEKLIHQAEFGNPNLASLGELKGCLLQVNLDTCIEIAVILLYCAHQPQY
jgi:hypothetical protein